MASFDVCSALPNTVWPIFSAATWERSSACRAATTPSWVAERSFSDPPKVPKPVRTPERNTTSPPAPWVFMETQLPWSDRGISAVGRGGGRAAVRRDAAGEGLPHRECRYPCRDDAAADQRLAGLGGEFGRH